MARVKGIIEFYESGNAATITPPLPDHVSGDAILVFANKDDVAGGDSNTGSSGWTRGGTIVSAGTTTLACRASWYYKVAASSEESLTITNSDSDSWTVTSIVIEGAHSTMIDTSNTNGISIATNPAGPYQAAAVTTANNNSLVFYVMCSSGSAPSPFPGARTISSHDSANESMGIAMKIQKTAGNTGTYNFFPDDHDLNQQNSVTFTVAVRDSGTLDYMPAYLNTDHAQLVTPFRGSVNTLRGETWATAITNIPVLGQVDNKAVYQYDDSTTTFYDVTTAANNATASDWTLLNNSPAPAANDYTAFCLDYPYIGFRVLYTTAAVGGTRAWQVYNGSSWVSLTVTDGSTSFTAAAATIYNITMTIAQLRTISGIWRSSTLNGTTGYWLRCRWSTPPTTNPTMSYMRPMYGYTLYDAVASVADAGANPYHNTSSFTPAVAVQGEWGGTYLTLGTDVTPITPTNKFLVGTWQYNTPRDYIDTSMRAELGGVAVTFADSSFNSRTYIIGGYKSADTSQDDRNMYVIQWSSSTKTYPTPLSGTDPTTISYVGVFAHQLRGAGSQQFNQLVSLSAPVLSGGTSSNPITNDEFFKTFNIEYFYPIPYFRNGIMSIPFQIGGGDAVHLFLNLAQIKFPQRTTEPDPFASPSYCAYHIDTGAMGITFDARSGDTCKITNSVLSGDTSWSFTFTATASSGATWDFSGTSVINAIVTLKNVMTFSSITFTSPVSIDATGCTLDNCTIGGMAAGNDTLTTSSTTVISNSSITTTTVTAGNRWCSVAYSDLDIFSGNTFTGSHTSGHPIRISSAGSVSFSGNTFTNYGPAAIAFHTQTDVDPTGDTVTAASHGYTTADPVYYQDQGGSDTIGLTDGNLYYVRADSASLLGFFPTSADASANTNRIALSDGATGQTHYIYSAGAAIYNNSSGSVTITITNGGSIPSIRNSDGSSTTIIANVNVTITIYDQSGTAIPGVEVAIFQDNAARTVILASTATNASGQVTTTAAQNTGAIIIRARQSTNKANFNSGTGIDAGTEVITTNANHNLRDGDAVVYSKNGGSAVTNLTDGSTYYVNNITATTLSLHTTAANAIADTSRVDLASAGAETHSLDPVRYFPNSATGSIGATDFTSQITMITDSIATG